MSAKRWAITFIALIAACLLVIMSLNFFVDPYHYFSSQSGDDYDLDENDYLRELKAEHIRHFNKNYDAYLVGGSKAGAVRPSKLKELDGYDYYNCWVLSGNFPDYLAYVKYIVENTEAKKILLQISTSELYEFDRMDYGTIYEVPAILSGESKAAEVVSFLMKNPKVAWGELFDRSEKYPCLESGERDLTHYYDYQRDNLENGYFYWRMTSDSEKYYKFFDTDLEDLDQNKEECIRILKEIKALCEEHDVELQVYFASLFAAQMVQYESDTFYDFMEEVVMICGDVWCFNTYNEVCRCMYNYYNPSHFYYEVGDLMVDTMAGKKCPYKGFGQLLTRENIGSVIAQRRIDYQRWKDYYKKYGILSYMPLDSNVNLVNINNR